MNRKLVILSATLVLASCMKEENKANQKSVISDTSYFAKKSDSLPEEPFYKERDLITFEGDSGVLSANFLEAEMGDYAHISVADSADRFASFYVLSDNNISEKDWEGMMDGKFKDKKVEIRWKNERTFIEPISAYDTIMVVKELNVKE